MISRTDVAVSETIAEATTGAEEEREEAEVAEVIAITTVEVAIEIGSATATTVDARTATKPEAHTHTLAARQAQDLISAVQETAQCGIVAVASEKPGQHHDAVTVTQRGQSVQRAARDIERNDLADDTVHLGERQPPTGRRYVGLLFGHLSMTLA